MAVLAESCIVKSSDGKYLFYFLDYKKIFALYKILVSCKNSSFLAHLSRRLIWWAYRIGRPPSSVVRRRLRPHSLNIFSSETTGPIKVKFHMELLWGGGTKVCSNGPSHMTKMVARPIYGKNLKKSSSLEPKGRWPWNLVCVIGCLSTTKFAQMMILGWPWPILRQSQIWSLMLLYGQKVKQWIFQKLLWSMIWN